MRFGLCQVPVAAQEPEGAKLLNGVYLTREGLGQVLEGVVPSQNTLKKHEDFYVDEIRVGLERSDEKRTAKDGYLYNIIHVRPKREAALAVYVSGIPPAWRVKDQLAVPLGGEGRLAAVQVMSGNPSEILPPAPFLVAGRDGKVRFTVILVTPG